MGKFDRNNKPGGFKSSGGFGGRKDFKGRGFGGGGKRSFGDRDQARPQMFKGTCSKCGKECQLPFRPTGERPVFCSNCFALQGNTPFDRSESTGFGRPRFEDKKLFQAVCSGCGEGCEVPFRPMDGKPVFCNNCFHKDGSTSRNTEGRRAEVKSSDNYKVQFDMLNAKLDKILKALTSSEVVEVEGAGEEFVETDAMVVKKKAIGSSSKIKATKKTPKKKK